MKIGFYSFIFSILSLVCHGQNINDLILESEAQLSKNHWVKAHDGFKEILAVHEAQLTYLQQAEIYNHLGYLNLMFLNPEKAERELNRSLLYHEEAGIPNERSYAKALLNTGMLYLEQVEFDLARDYVKRGLAILGKKEEWTVDYLVARSRLARIYEEAGSYTLALSIYDESYENLLAVGNYLSPDFADICSHKGRILTLTGDPGEGERFINLSATIYESLGSDYNVQRAESLEDLALFYEQMGRYDEAEELLLQILALKRSIPDEADILIIETLNDLGILYNELGEFSKAEQMFEEVVQKCEENVGLDHPFYATAKNNLGSIALNGGSYREAKILFQDALLKFETRYGSSHPYYADALNNLARAERKLGNHDKAESYYKEVLELDRKLYGDQDPSYAATLLNIGILLSSDSREAEAEKYYEEALAIRKEVLGVNHPAYGSALEYTGIHYLAVDKLEEAELNFRESIQIQINQVRALFPIMNERERELFYFQVKEDVARYNYVASMLLDSKPELIRNIFDFQAKTKTLLFNSLDKVHDAALDSGDPILLEEYKKWLNDKRLLASYYQMGVEQLAELHVNLSRVESDIAAQEKNLMQKIEAFDEALPQEQLGWQYVFDYVNPDEAIVEIVRIHEFSPIVNGQESIYGFSGRCGYLAIVFKHGMQDVAFTFLGDPSSTDSDHFTYCQNVSVLDYDSQEFFTKYWKPIMDLTRDAANLYVVPDGKFYTLNPNRFKINKKDYVINKQYVTYLTSTHDLMRPKASVLNNKLCLVANPGFAGAIVPELNPSTFVQEPSFSIHTDGGFDWKINEYRQRDASEYKVRSLYSPTILHIAVPGFFASKKPFIEDKTPLVSSLFSSGLFFTGVQDSYQKFTAGLSSIPENDGILTAYDMLKLELDRTRLVFLSSITIDEEGLNEGEGFHGLLRAFTVAGARNVISTVRHIAPEMKKEFLETFYGKVFETDEIRSSFRYAQLEMKKKYSDTDSWGAFILTGSGQ